MSTTGLVYWIVIGLFAIKLAVCTNKLPHEDEDEKVELEPNFTSHGNNSSSTVPSHVGNMGFFQAFFGAFSVIVVSELGDKTFFIAAIMAMKHSRILVFLGAILALTVMTVLSVAFGMAAQVIPKVYTYYISTILFLIFGVKMLFDGFRMSSTEGQEELEEVQADLIRREEELAAKQARDIEPSTPPPDIVLTNQVLPEIEIIERRIDNTTGGNYDIEQNDSSINGKDALPPQTKILLAVYSEKSKFFQIKTLIPFWILTLDVKIPLFISECGFLEMNIPISFWLSSLGPYKPIGVLIWILIFEHAIKFSKSKFEKEALNKDPEVGVRIKHSSRKKLVKLLSHIVFQAFTLTFLAEWGDRSQITTIILAARDNMYGVALGGVLGHSLCTGLAVLGGRFVAQKISVKTVTICGGIVFIVFALMTFFLDASSSPSPEETKKLENL